MQERAMAFEKAEVRASRRESIVDSHQSQPTDRPTQPTSQTTHPTQPNPTQYEKKKAFRAKVAALEGAKTEPEIVEGLDNLTKFVLEQRGLPQGIKKQQLITDIRKVKKAGKDGKVRTCTSVHRERRRHGVDGDAWHLAMIGRSIGRPSLSTLHNTNSTGTRRQRSPTSSSSTPSTTSRSVH